MIRLVLFVSLILGACVTRAQDNYVQSLSIGTTWITFFDSKWPITPSTQFINNRTGERNILSRISLPVISYRRDYSNKTWIGAKVITSKRSQPVKSRSDQSPHAIWRTVFQVQATGGKVLSFRNFKASVGSGLAYQHNTKWMYLYSAPILGGTAYEAVVADGKKQSIAVPIEVIVERSCFKQINLGICTNYSFSIFDYKFDIPGVKEEFPERHSLVLSFFIGYEFGKSLKE